MLFRLVQPMRRKDSRIPQFVKRIPDDVAHRIVGKKLDVPLREGVKVPVTITGKTVSIRFSLRTADPSEAKIRHANASAYIEEVFTAFRQNGAVPLSHEQAVGFSKRFYEGWASASRLRTLSVELYPSYMLPDGATEADQIGPVTSGETPHLDAALYEHLQGVFAGSLEASDIVGLEADLGPIIDRQLLREGIAEVDSASRSLLLLECARALKDAFALRHRQLAEGDYAPDTNANRFPPFDHKTHMASNIKPQSLTQLVEDWWIEAKATGLKPSTHESYRNTMVSFVSYLKHDIAHRVTPEDVIGFKDHRLATINQRTGQPISPKTVKDSDLAGLKAVFEWAVSNRRITANPAKGVTIKVRKRAKLRSKGFTDAEAAAILKAASAVDLSHKPSRTNVAIGWVPWLMAYTGARVGEIAQLRKQDVRREGEHWVITITPDAGTVKTNEAREVVLHAHLVEMGFPVFVASSSPGHLFVVPSKATGVAGPLKGLTNRLAAFARRIVSDPNVHPNHGWRHRFKTVGRSAGIDGAVLDAIQGHAPATVGDAYGGNEFAAQALAMAKIPRIDVG